MTSLLIRPEKDSDRDAIRWVNEAAFETPAEARLVERLREQAAPVVSLVAEDERGVVGHIMFSPVTLPGEPSLKLMGLAPMAVLSEYQNQGIGSALVREGLGQCRRLGFEGVVVLGHPGYYPRFGFIPAKDLGFDCEYDVPDDVFLVLELSSGSLEGFSGTLHYHPVFAEL